MSEVEFRALDSQCHDLDLPAVCAFRGKEP